MNLYPSVKVVAKRQSKLTHRVREQTLVNFDRYDSSNYLERLDGYSDEFYATYKELQHHLSDEHFPLEEEVFEGRKFSKKFLDISDNNLYRIWGHMRFILFDMYSLKQYESGHKDFPYEVIGINFNYIHGKDDQETYKKLASAVCDPLSFLLNYKDLKLTSRQKDSLIVLPYWGDFSQNRADGITYKEFENMGAKELKGLLLGEFKKIPLKERRDWIKNLEDFLNY